MTFCGPWFYRTRLELQYFFPDIKEHHLAILWAFQFIFVPAVDVQVARPGERDGVCRNDLSSLSSSGRAVREASHTWGPLCQTGEVVLLSWQGLSVGFRG